MSNGVAENSKSDSVRMPMSSRSAISSADMDGTGLAKRTLRFEAQRLF